MSVVGFDIGNESCVIATFTKDGKIDVLTNGESDPKIAAVVCFDKKQRLFGSAADAAATLNPRSTISQVKRLIGSDYIDPLVKKDLQQLLYPYETSEAINGGVLINLEHLKETQTFKPVQIMGMLFAHLKEVAEKALQSTVSHCVIGIPSYFTDLQRRAYIDAARIAGLEPLRLMHDCTAIALCYGFDNHAEFSNSGLKIVVFVDIGHCDTQVTVAAFENGGMAMLSHAFDNHLGGRDFDELLCEHFAGEFKEKYNIDVYSDNCASTRLRKECEILKNVLSTNDEAQLNIEDFMDVKKVTGSIKREDFESLCSTLFERVCTPCYKAVNDAGISVGDIYAVELVGCGSCIPAIKRNLGFVFGRKPRTEIASGSVAKGCALQCAMLSPTFSNEKYEFRDSFPFSIGLQSTNGAILKYKDSGVNVFPKGTTFPCVMSVVLPGHKSVYLEAVYTNKEDLPVGVSPGFTHFTIGPFSSVEEAKLRVVFRLDVHGIVKIESASLVEDDPSNNDLPCPSKRIAVSEYVVGGTTEDELSEAKETERKLAAHDIEGGPTIKKRNALESFIIDTRTKVIRPRHMAGIGMQFRSNLALVVKEKGRPSRVEEKSKNNAANVVKRPVGRPSKKRARLA